MFLENSIFGATGVGVVLLLEELDEEEPGVEEAGVDDVAPELEPACEVEPEVVEETEASSLTRFLVFLVTP